MKTENKHASISLMPQEACSGQRDITRRDLKIFAYQYGINTGLVHYHFKKKELLAKEIYSSIIDETNELISSVVDKEQPPLHFVMLFHIMWKYFGDSPAYARFVKEVIHIRIHSEAVFIPCLTSCYSLNDHYRLGLTELDCKIRDLALIGSQVELINAFLSGTLPSVRRSAPIRMLPMPSIF